MGNILVTPEASVVFEPEDKYTELLLGCGMDRTKLICIDEHKQWENLITLDISESVNPDVVHDLNVLPYPFQTESFNEIHAYEVLEHTGYQGDWEFFFDQFSELHRILKPGGLLYVTVPSWDSAGAWGDPGHTRIINEVSITFLQQERYNETSVMTDYRPYYKADFEAMAAEHVQQRFMFCLRKK